MLDGTYYSERGSSSVEWHPIYWEENCFYVEDPSEVEWTCCVNENLLCCVRWGLRFLDRHWCW